MEATKDRAAFVMPVKLAGSERELRFLRDLSYEDISRILSLPMGTVKTRIRRARKLLMEE